MRDEFKGTMRRRDAPTRGVGATDRRGAFEKGSLREGIPTPRMSGVGRVAPLADVGVARWLLTTQGGNRERPHSGVGLISIQMVRAVAYLFSSASCRIRQTSFV
jgi:hypothetical protein